MRIRRTRMRGLTAACAVIGAAAVALAGCSQASNGSSGGTTASSTKNVKIGVAIGFEGNAWTAAMAHSITVALGDLKSQGKISGSTVTNANGSVSTQISQVQNMVLAHDTAIVIQPTSTSGLNGVIKTAEKANIKVVIFAEGPVTINSPYEVEDNLIGAQKQIAADVLNEMHGKGNVIDVRGTAGTGTDNGMQQGNLDTLKKFPKVKVVSTVYGDWNTSVTETAVQRALPALGSVQGVIDQGGGDIWGALQAFRTAGRPTPKFICDNTIDCLQYWAQQHKKNGFTTDSAAGNPGMGAVAVDEGYLLTQGKKVPKDVNDPFLWITQKTMMHYLKVDKKIGVGYIIPSLSEVESHLKTWSCADDAACGWPSS